LIDNYEIHSIIWLIEKYINWFAYGVKKESLYTYAHVKTSFIHKVIHICTSVRSYFDEKNILFLYIDFPFFIRLLCG